MEERILLSSKKKNIIFDIAVETYLNNATNYSFRTIIECKNYDGNVPVDDVEEFDSKLNQIGEHNTKGIIITKTAFQVSASNLAMSKGIGIAIINSDNEIDWISYRKDSNSSAKEYKDSNSSDKIISKSFFAYFDNLSFDNLPDLLINMGIIDKYFFQQNKIYIPFKTTEQIEQIISRLQVDRIYKENRLNTNELCKHLSETLDVKFIFEENLGSQDKDNILGKITFKPLRIYITNELKQNVYRWRFTLAHEVGHLLLHNELLKDYLGENIDIEKSLSLSGEFPKEMNKYMEIQANKFASILLLPAEPFLKEVGNYFVEQNINKGFLYLDHQRVNRNLVYNLLSRLKEKFEVSMEVAKYRLVSFELIKGETMKSVKDILNNK